jgi:hypothetical protein
MWIFCKSGFLSIVEDQFAKGKLLVRARVEDDMSNFVSLLDEISGTGHRIEETPERDYRFRTTANQEVVAQAIFEIVSSIDYGNFKNSVHGEPDRDVAYMQVWSVMNGFQQGKL